MAEAQPAAQVSTSPFHQPASDNAGNITRPLAAHARAGLVSDADYEGLPPDQQANYARMPKAGDQGGAEWISREQVATDSTKPAITAPAAGEKVKIGDMEVSAAELQEFFKSKGEAELKKAALPATPADYKTDLPANFEMPAGVEFKVDEADPLLLDARAWAHGKGFSQADFSELVGIYATAKGKEEATLTAAKQAEIGKLGANGTQRVTALDTWIRGMVGDRLAGPMRSMLVTADIVKGWEILQHKFSSQGAAAFSQAHREPGSNGRLSESEYNAMSPAARLDYAHSVDQSQFGPNKLTGR
jgi:hypothetical protein